MPKYNDSIEKVNGYIDNLVKVDNATISDLFYRKFNCPEGCGGCCPKFSLDYWGQRWDDFKMEYPELVENFEHRIVNGVDVWTDTQADNETRSCKYLNMENGRCGIHTVNPMSCEFEPIKVSHNTKHKKTYVIKKLFGRGWALTKIDGTKGAMCTMGEQSYENVPRDIHLFKELREIAGKDNVEAVRKIDQIIDELEHVLEINKFFT